MPIKFTYTKRVKVTEEKHTEEELDEMYGEKEAKTWEDLKPTPSAIASQFDQPICFDLKFTSDEEVTDEKDECLRFENWRIVYDPLTDEITVDDSEEENLKVIPTTKEDKQFLKMLKEVIDERPGESKDGALFQLTFPIEKAPDVLTSNMLVKYATIGYHYWSENQGRNEGVDKDLDGVAPGDKLSEILQLN
jgi:hypothetical protein